MVAVIYESGAASIRLTIGPLPPNSILIVQVFGMPGAGVEPPSPPAEAAAWLPPRRLRPGRVSAKRCWPPGCGRFPSPPPAPASAAEAGPEVKGVDGASTIVVGRADEKPAPAVISPSAQNGCPDKVEAPAPVSPAPESGAPPADKVEEVADPAAVSPACQNCAPPQQEENKVEVVAAILPAAHSSALPHALTEKDQQNVVIRENGEAQLLGDAGKLSLDGQQGNNVVQVAVLGSSSTVGASYLQNGDKGGGLLVAEEKGRGGSSDVGQEVAVNGDVSEIANKTGTGELQRKENGTAGSRTKRWFVSSLNPPPKRREVSAVRRFPPGCGRTAVTTTDSGVLEVSPISTFAPGHGRSGVNTTGSGNEGLPSEATPVNNNDALVASSVLGELASPTSALEASNKKLESKRIVGEGHSKAHNKVQVQDDFAGTKQDGGQRNVVPKATPRSVSDGKMKGKLPAHKANQVAQEVMVGKMKNKLDGSFQRSNLRTPLSNPIDAKTKVKRSDSDKMNAGVHGNAGASAGGKMENKTLSAKKEVGFPNMNTKQKKVAPKLKGDVIGKDNMHLSARELKLGKYVATDHTEEPKKQIIVQALMAPDNCPWARGRKSIASAFKSLGPMNKAKGKDASASKQCSRKC